MLAGLPRENYLRGLPADRLRRSLTYYLAEINAVHPFREGNGRTQRAFVGQLAEQAGYHLAWEKLTPERNVETAVAAMRGDNAPLRQALGELDRARRQGRPGPAGRELPPPAAYATRRHGNAGATTRPPDGPGASPGIER